MAIDEGLHRRRSIDVGRRRRRIMIVAARGDHVSREREVASLSAPPLVPFMKYMVPLLLGLVAMKYQGKSESLFVENPAPLWCFIAATCVYWLIVGAIKQNPTCDATRWLSRSAYASGVLSALSLLSIFLHHPFSLVPLVIWITMSALLFIVLQLGFISKIKTKLAAWGDGKFFGETGIPLSIRK